MADQATVRSLSATVARHHSGFSLRIVLHVGPGEHFVLLSSADGATIIHAAIDADGNIGGDWWGQAHGTSPMTALQAFAESEQLPLSDLLTVIRPLDTLTPLLCQCATRDRSAESSPKSPQRPLEKPSTPRDDAYAVAAIASCRSK